MVYTIQKIRNSESEFKLRVFMMNLLPGTPVVLSWLFLYGATDVHQTWGELPGGQAVVDEARTVEFTDTTHRIFSELPGDPDLAYILRCGDRVETAELVNIRSTIK
jgi:hypothetical protein